MISLQLAANNRRRKDLYTLPRGDEELLATLGYKEKLAEVDSAIQMNAEFLQDIAKDPGMFEEKPEDDNVSERSLLDTLDDVESMSAFESSSKSVLTE